MNDCAMTEEKEEIIIQACDDLHMG